MNLSYTFTTKLWVYPGEAAWHFITLPVQDASDIKSFCSHIKRGFGSIRVTATIGSSTWQTSIFPDAKSKSYLLPVKKEVRLKNSLVENSEVIATVTILENK